MSDVIKVHAKRSGDQILFRVWNGKAYVTEELTESQLRNHIVVEAVKEATTDALSVSDSLIFKAAKFGFSIFSGRFWSSSDEPRRTLDSPWEGEKS